MKYSWFAARTVVRVTVTLILMGVAGVAGVAGAGCAGPYVESVTVQVPTAGVAPRVRVGRFVGRGAVSGEKVRALKQSVVRSLRRSGFDVRRDFEQVQIAVVVEQFSERHRDERISDRQLLIAMLSLGFWIPVAERRSLGEIRVILYATFPDGRTVRRVFAAWSAARCHLGLMMWAIPTVTAYCRHIYRYALMRLTREILREVLALVKRPHQPATSSKGVRP